MYTYGYKFGLSHNFKAELVYSDNTTAGAVTISSVDAMTITATYDGKAGTAYVKPYIWKQFTSFMYVPLTESNVSGAISYEECKRYLAGGGSC